LNHGRGPIGIAAFDVWPDSAFGIEGMERKAIAIVPGVRDPSLADRIIEIPTSLCSGCCRRSRWLTEDAQRMARRPGREEGPPAYPAPLSRPRSSAIALPVSSWPSRTTSAISPNPG
jgi:hypothetical protein